MVNGIDEKNGQIETATDTTKERREAAVNVFTRAVRTRSILVNESNSRRLLTALSFFFQAFLRATRDAVRWQNYRARDVASLTIVINGTIVSCKYLHVRLLTTRSRIGSYVIRIVAFRRHVASPT